MSNVQQNQLTIKHAESNESACLCVPHGDSNQIYSCSFIRGQRVLNDSNKMDAPWHCERHSTDVSEQVFVSHHLGGDNMFTVQLCASENLQVGYEAEHCSTRYKTLLLNQWW